MTSYTKYPRPTLWLLPEGDVTIGGLEADTLPTFEAEVAAFYISREPVSNVEYEAFCQHHERSPLSPTDDGPAVGVSYQDATAYCEWYTGLRGQTFRLPTEVEWEYACRANSSKRYFFGDDPAGGDAFLWDTRNCSEVVGDLTALKANRFGIYGMLGCVWEWTGSTYHPYPLSSADIKHENRPTEFVLRGGSFRLDRSEFGCATRRASQPDVRPKDAGFRIVRSLK